MAQVIADRRDVDFVLYEQLKVDVAFTANKAFSEFNKKTTDLIISEARNLAIKEILPTQKPGDEEGCRFENGNVFVPESFKRLWKLYNEGEWLALTEEVEYGGQATPRVISMAAHDYFIGANYAFMMYPGLTQGAAKLIETFGTDTLKSLFLKKMYTGVWTGTMLLTEPEAGSDVGALSTEAKRCDDGTYLISGSKIFISSGEHDLSENIIHPTLARIEGAPSGTKGLSLFLVPKIWVNEDGSLGDANDVVCTGIEKKMGIHGNATASLTLGGKGECRGYLLGEENKGMRAMFLMMNEARLLVGMQGFCCASTSYLNALNYAKERVQGRHLLKMGDPTAQSVPIIQHPDVRRMLITMKAYVEGMRSLLYYVQFLEDQSHMIDDTAEKERLSGMVDLLIPICKGYVTDKAFEMCSIGIQVYGGYGYIKEYPQEQLLRDCRITMIYEGTNGIQSMDLLGRKLGLNQGKPIMDIMGEIQKTVARAKKIEAFKEKSIMVEDALNRLAEVAVHLGGLAVSPKVLHSFAFSQPFMETAGDVVMAWMLLWRAIIAHEAMEKGARKKDIAFYNGLIKSSDFFIYSVLPVTLGKMQAILYSDPSAIDIADESF